MQKKKQTRQLKKLQLLILLPVLLMQMSYTQSVSQLSNGSGVKYGIDLEKNYTGREVRELIEIIMQEAEAAIVESYNSGYKQGVLAYKGDVEYWKVKAAGFEKALQKQKLQSFMLCFSGVSIGFLGGMGLGFGLRLSY